MNEETPLIHDENLLNLAVDYYTRYPHEPVSLFVSFQAPVQANSTLQIILPKMIEVESHRLPEAIQSASPVFIETRQQRQLEIPLGALPAGNVWYEVEVRARIQSYYVDHYLIFEAQILTGNHEVISHQGIQVAVRRQADYLKNLPELYESDDFINRFLMLFESFWKPIRLQIDGGESYYDPLLTPNTMVPWLASWVGLPVDPTLPTHRVRALLKSAMLFYQCRGTLQTLKTYLEIYTGGEVAVTERRARNFVLGSGNVLGMETALGSTNHPNLVLVRISVPAGELERMQFDQMMYLQKMNDIVRSMVPAHVVYEVHCEFHETAQPLEA